MKIQGLIGKTIITISDSNKLNLCNANNIKLIPNDEHIVIEESNRYVITNKSNGQWVSKFRFKQE